MLSHVWLKVLDNLESINLIQHKFKLIKAIQNRRVVRGIHSKIILR